MPRKSRLKHNSAVVRHTGVPVCAGLQGRGLVTVPSAAAGPRTTEISPAELRSVQTGLCPGVFPLHEQHLSQVSILKIL